MSDIPRKDYGETQQRVHAPIFPELEALIRARQSKSNCAAPAASGSGGACELPKGGEGQQPKFRPTTEAPVVTKANPPLALQRQGDSQAQEDHKELVITPIGGVIGAKKEPSDHKPSPSPKTEVREPALNTSPPEQRPPVPAERRVVSTAEPASPQRSDSVAGRGDSKQVSAEKQVVAQQSSQRKPELASMQPPSFGVVGADKDTKISPVLVQPGTHLPVGIATMLPETGAGLPAPEQPPRSQQLGGGVSPISPPESQVGGGQSLCASRTAELACREALLLSRALKVPPNRAPCPVHLPRAHCHRTQIAFPRD